MLAVGLSTLFVVAACTAVGGCGFEHVLHRCSLTCAALEIAALIGVMLRLVVDDRRRNALRREIGGRAAGRRRIDAPAPSLRPAERNCP